MKTHKDLDAWKEAINFVTEIYRYTEKFPDVEKFGLTSQIRRASVSVPSNIAEGAARNSNKEYLQFLNYALGSISEIETQLIIALNLNFISDEQYKQLDTNLTTIRKLLLGLIKYIRNKKHS